MSYIASGFTQIWHLPQGSQQVRKPTYRALPHCTTVFICWSNIVLTQTAFEADLTTLRMPPLWIAAMLAALCDTTCEAMLETILVEFGFNACVRQGSNEGTFAWTVALICCFFHRHPGLGLLPGAVALAMGLLKWKTTFRAFGFLHNHRFPGHALQAKCFNQLQV